MVEVFNSTNFLDPAITITDQISILENDLLAKYKDIIRYDMELNRKIVSFQANKGKPGYRWYKFKEAFSSDLIDVLLERYNINGGNLLDPFAGSGTALFAASTKGINTDGIELLPLAQRVIDSRINIIHSLSQAEIDEIRTWIEKKEWEVNFKGITLPSIRISQGAYPEITEQQIERYLFLIDRFPEKKRELLFFALLCILEKISYTRKDGQYLRWDYRAKKQSFGKKIFTKGEIPSFTTAIQSKVQEILSDIDFLKNSRSTSKDGLIRLFSGSNLELLPEFCSDSYNAIITSPPYCNRYDYTRTYALELALLGLDDKDVIDLRQNMLSSTVENRKKQLLTINPNWRNALTIFENQPMLQSILGNLDFLKTTKQINNSGIPRMVRGYFEEMSCIISECYRVLKKDSVMIVVNDNVRYEGISIPVDLILSDIANEIGFSIENILVLQDKKGNSSQQMGKLGKDTLRKCVYIWRKK